jgi:hypothetical protein
MMEPKCIVCKAEATMDSPSDLCDQHWQDWWDHKIEINDDRKTWRYVQHEER